MLGGIVDGAIAVEEAAMATDTSREPPLDLEPIRKDLAWYAKYATIGPKAIGNMRLLLTEVERLRAQVAAVRALAEHPPSPKILPREIFERLDEVPNA